MMLYIIFIYNKNSSLVLVGSSHKRQKMQANFLLFLWRIFHLFLFNFFVVVFCLGYWLAVFICCGFIYVEHGVNNMQRVKMKRDFPFGLYIFFYHLFFMFNLQTAAIV